jgi:three-Cys-motif partner protein
MVSRIDEVGYWTELKLEIIKEYCTAYSQILSSQKNPKLWHVYVDAFSGPGFHISKAKKGFIKGSPMNALAISPPFKEFHLIDKDGGKMSILKQAIGDRSDVFLHEGDCNELVISKILPRVRYADYKRGLFLIDPYGLHLNWRVVEEVGKAGSIDMFLNFPIMDMNMNALLKNPEAADPLQIKRMDLFWGDNSWKEIAYSTEPDLFGQEFIEKNENIDVVQGYVERLKKVAGFKYVAKPIAMRNRNKAVVYYLLFASHKPVAVNIVEQIFDKYKDRGF